jgi:alkyldihydroxyacetonephosphate synthase
MPFIKEEAGINTSKNLPLPTDINVPPPILNKDFITELGAGPLNYSRRSFEKWERLQISHGQCANEISLLRFAKIARVVDMVVYPTCTEHIISLVKLANKHNVVLIPVGGTTCVSNALLMPLTEERMIVAVDMMRFSKLLYVDKENMVASA